MKSINLLLNRGVFSPTACRAYSPWLIVAAGLFLTPISAGVAQTAQARLFCLSLRFQQGRSAGGDFTLDLTLIAPPSAPNGELAPSFDTPSHLSGFILNDPNFPEPFYGSIAFDVPRLADANANGFEDFFEVSQAVSGTTTGFFQTAVDSGSVRATWSRAAGSKDGTCVLRLTGNLFGQLPDVTHAFELIEYAGPLTYAPGTNKVTGSLNLAQTQAPANRLSGLVEFSKSSTKRFDELEIPPGAWTNALAQSLSYTNAFLSRDVIAKTNYSGVVEFIDGDPATPEEDFFTWVLSIDDANDTDGDGIPNFSDDPGSPLAQPPKLSVSSGTTNLVLSIRGTVGRLHEIQEAASLAAPNWNTVLSITLTNDTQVASFPFGSGAAQFYRVRVP